MKPTPPQPISIEAYRQRRRQAQIVALEVTTHQIRTHLHRALELGQTVNAYRLAEALERWLSTVEAIAREER